MLTKITPAQVRGKLALGEMLGIGETIVSGVKLPGLWHFFDETENLLVYDWAESVSRLMSGRTDGKNYEINGMYLEFENNLGNPVTPPTYDRSGAAAYYSSLSTHTTIDYLRVPIVAVGLTTTDSSKYPTANKITFFAMTQGTQGVHGKPFNDSNQSRVFGGALVCVPDWNDASQDIIFSRTYVASSDQLIKSAGKEITAKWEVTFI